MTDVCDKCGTPVELWATTPCVRSLTQSPRHTVTRFYLGDPFATDSEREAAMAEKHADDEIERARLR